MSLRRPLLQEEASPAEPLRKALFTLLLPGIVSGFLGHPAKFAMMQLRLISNFLTFWRTETLLHFLPYLRGLEYPLVGEAEGR